MIEEDTAKNMKNGIWYDPAFKNHWIIARRFDLTGLTFLPVGDTLLITGDSKPIKRLFASLKRKGYVSGEATESIFVSFYDLTQTIV